MKNLPTKYLLSKKPREYLTQGLSHCGVYCVKAILSSFGKDDKKHPKDYHSNWIGRNFFSFATGDDYYDKIFASYKVKSKTKSAESLIDQDKLNLLKTLLSKNTPVMIRIGNGYYKSKEYNTFLGKLVPHWITFWGYNDEKQIFYVYDSGMLKEHWDQNLPVGNTTRTYQEILRDWNFGRWQPLCWNTSSRNNLYVEIKNG